MRLASARRAAALLLLPPLLAVSSGCGESNPASDQPDLNDSLHAAVAVQAYPHDPTAYTQGLLFHDGHLYESTGLTGHSTLRRVDLPSGDVLERVELGGSWFAEGLARVGQRLIQLTWRNRTAFFYDLETLDSLGSSSFSGEGWGLAYRGDVLLRSDGSDTLLLHRPTDFALVGRILVRDDGRPVEGLNELGMVRGELWANLYPTDWIVRVDPVSGEVLGRVDAGGLLPDSLRPGSGVLNGIAWDEARDRVFLTGKRWPRLYEIKLIPLDSSSTDP